MSARAVLDIIQRPAPPDMSMPALNAELCALDGTTPDLCNKFTALFTQLQADKVTFVGILCSRFNAITILQLFKSNGLNEADLSNLNVILGSGSAPFQWEGDGSGKGSVPESAQAIRSHERLNGSGGDEQLPESAESNRGKRGGSRKAVFPTLTQRRPELTEYDLPFHLRNWAGTQTSFLKAMVKEVSNPFA